MLNLLHAINEVIFVKCLEQCEVHSKCNISDDLKNNSHNSHNPMCATNIPILQMDKLSNREGK